VLCSASPDLLRQSSESLAGRIAHHTLPPLTLDEVGANALERDVPPLGLTIPATTLRRFWTMLAHCHGQVWKASEFARAFGVTDHTVRRHLDVLVSTFVVRILQPCAEDIRKRQVKSPKIYLADASATSVL